MFVHVSQLFSLSFLPYIVCVTNRNKNQSSGEGTDGSNWEDNSRGKHVLCVRDQNIEKRKEEERFCITNSLAKNERLGTEIWWENAQKDYIVYVYDFLVSVLLNLMMWLHHIWKMEILLHFHLSCLPASFSMLLLACRALSLLVKNARTCRHVNRRNYKASSHQGSYIHWLVFEVVYHPVQAHLPKRMNST